MTPANMGSPRAVVLIDPSTGNPYKAFSAPPANPVVVSAHTQSPLAIVPIDPNTGLPYDL